MAGSKSRAAADQPPNEGARLLALAMSDRGLNQEAVEGIIGASEGNVSHWKRGKRKPGRENAQRLYEEFGIESRAWDMPAQSPPPLPPPPVDDEPTIRDTEPAPPLTSEDQ